MDIELKLNQLKEARADKEKYRHAMKDLIELVKQSSEYQRCLELAEIAEELVAEIEEDIKLKSLEEYNGTKNKHPFEKVSIKIFKTFKILDPNRVRAWAWKNLPVAFKLDEEKIKDYAQKFGNVPGTEKGEEPRALISTDL